MNLEDKYDEIFDELYDMSYSKSSLKKAQDLFKVAETMNNLESMFEAQNEVMDHSNFTGNIEIFMTSFAWCRAMVDKYPGKFSDYDIIWKYKWAIDHALDFPQISLEKINELFEDLKSRSSANEKSRSITTLRMTMWRICNEPAKLVEAVQNFQKSIRDSNSDCAACLADLELQALLYLGRDEEAIQKAQPIITGKLTCAEIPHYTYGHILCATHQSDPDLALAYHKKGYKMVKDHSIDFIHNHMKYLINTEQLSAALIMFEKHLKQLKDSTPINRLQFCLNSLKLMKKLQEAKQTEVSINLPQGYKDLSAEGKVEVRKLKTTLHDQAQNLVKSFDARNGNSAFEKILKEVS
jgi:tetratricopeptide (TPR) repeat protein